MYPVPPRGDSTTGGHFSGEPVCKIQNKSPDKNPEEGFVGVTSQGVKAQSKPPSDGDRAILAALKAKGKDDDTEMGKEVQALLQELSKVYQQP